MLFRSYPELEFCTDNGAMIALAGCLRLQSGTPSKPAGSFAVQPRWPLMEMSSLALCIELHIQQSIGGSIILLLVDQSPGRTHRGGGGDKSSKRQARSDGLFFCPGIVRCKAKKKPAQGGLKSISWRRWRRQIPLCQINCCFAAIYLCRFVTGIPVALLRYCPKCSFPTLSLRLHRKRHLPGHSCRCDVS